MTTKRENLKTAWYLVDSAFPEPWAQEYAGKLGNPMVEAAFKEVAAQMVRSCVVELVRKGDLVVNFEVKP